MEYFGPVHTFIIVWFCSVIAHFYTLSRAPSPVVSPVVYTVGHESNCALLIDGLDGIRLDRFLHDVEKAKNET